MHRLRKVRLKGGQGHKGRDAPVVSVVANEGCGVDGLRDEEGGRVIITRIAERLPSVASVGEVVAGVGGEALRAEEGGDGVVGGNGGGNGGHCCGGCWLLWLCVSFNSSSVILGGVKRLIWFDLWL